MTSSKTILFLLNTLLMTNFWAIAQEEDLMGTTTEYLAESATSLPETESIYTTCDFDLENIESLLQYMPEICTEIFNNRTGGELYNLYLEESKSFSEFYKKLNDYELRDQVQEETNELSTYPFEAKLRNDTYRRVDWTQCVTSSNSSIADYLKCLKEKRLEMAELIPDVQK